MYPECLTPNVVTLCGMIPQILMILFCFHKVGLSLTAVEPVPTEVFFMCAFALQWFSWHDIMDGVRARRQKSGSPLGRLIDEALDIIQQTAYMLFMGYVFQVDNWVFETILISGNIIFMAMEMKHFLCHDLKMIMGEVGPVEIELIISLMFVVAGVFGNTGMQSTVGETFGFEFGLKWNQVCCGLWLPL